MNGIQIGRGRGGSRRGASYTSTRAGKPFYYEALIVQVISGVSTQYFGEETAFFTKRNRATSEHESTQVSNEYGSRGGRVRARFPVSG